MLNSEIFDSINPLINLDEYGDTQLEYSLTQDTCKWIREILDEIESDIESEKDFSGKPGFLGVHLYIQKKETGSYGVHLTIAGRVTTDYTAPCVRCLEPAEESSDLEFAAVYLNQHFEDTEEFQETSHIYIGQEEMELYFHEKGKVDIKELVREQLYMELEPLPVHDANCKGLCQVCGINLNHEECSHKNQ